MRTSARSLARLVGRDNATSRCRTVATATVARPAIVQRGCVPTVAVQAADSKGKAKQEPQEYSAAVLQAKRGVPYNAAWRQFGLQQQSSSWAQRSGSTHATSARFHHIHSLHTSATAHNAPRATGIGTPSPSASSTLPPPPPAASSNTPASLAGLGTTQLSPDIMLRCTIFDSTGSATSTSGVFKKSRLCSDHGLEPRDLRKIDSRVPNLVPTILARRGGILVNILHIRAMIKRDKVLLFDSYGSTDSQLHSAFVYNLQHNLRPLHHQAQHHGSSSSSSSSSVAGSGGLAYEFRALESILVSVLDALRIELGVVRGWTSGVLEQLDDDVDREKLRTLLQVSRKLNAFLSRSKAVKNAVVEVLENEEDMQLMYLSTAPPSNNNNSSSSSSATSTSSSLPNASSSTNNDNAAETNESQAMDELELLLESFDKQVEEVVAETTQLHSDITNTQEVVELILDNNRNKLLALDLKTSIATMGISAGTLWAGLFGMNLKSHMEELDWAFAVVSGVAFGAVVLTAGVGLRRLERLRKVGLGMRGKIEDRNKGGWLERLGARRRKRLEGAAGGSALNVGGVHAPGVYQPAFAGVYGGYPMQPHFAPGPAGNGYGAQPFSPHGEPQQQHASSWLPHGVHLFPPEPIADTSSTSPSRPSASATATAKGSQQAAEEVAEASAASAAGGSLGMGLGSKWDAAGGSGAGKKRRGKT